MRGNMAERPSPRIAIVGAGMAGLSAAHHLVCSGLTNVIVLEAADRIGGRIHTLRFGDGDMPVELGANWIHGSGCRNSSFQLADSIGALTPHRIWNRMSGKFLREDGTEIDREIVSYGVNQYNNMMEEAQRMLADRNAKEHGKCANLGRALNEMISEWFARNAGAERNKDLMRVFNALLNYSAMHEGDDLDRVSYELSETTCVMPGGDIHIPAGYVKLLHHLLKFLPPGCVKLRSEVMNIQWSTNTDGVNIVLKSGKTVMADHVIVTCSLGVLKACRDTLFTPPLPVEKVKVIESIGFGCVNKILLEYERSIMQPNTQNVLFSWNDTSIRNMETDWFKRIIGFDKIYTKRNVLLGWVSGDAAIHMESLKDDEIAKTCTRLLRQFLGDPDFPEPRRVLVSRWKSDRLIRGSYSYQTPKFIPDEQNILSRPLTTPSGKPVVLFAGEATHQQHYSCTHGARDSGIREANILLGIYRQELGGSKL